MEAGPSYTKHVHVPIPEGGCKCSGDENVFGHGKRCGDTTAVGRPWCYSRAKDCPNADKMEKTQAKFYNVDASEIVVNYDICENMTVEQANCGDEEIYNDYTLCQKINCCTWSNANSTDNVCENGDWFDSDDKLCFYNNSDHTYELHDNKTCVAKSLHEYSDSDKVETLKQCEAKCYANKECAAFRWNDSNWLSATGTDCVLFDKCEMIEDLTSLSYDFILYIKND